MLKKELRFLQSGHATSGRSRTITHKQQLQIRKVRFSWPTRNDLVSDRNDFFISILPIENKRPLILNQISEARSHIFSGVQGLQSLGGIITVFIFDSCCGARYQYTKVCESPLAGKITDSRQR